MPPRIPQDAVTIMGSAHLGAQLLAELVDQFEAAAALDMPEGPAVAGRRALQLGGDKVDRAAMLGGDDTAVGAHPRAPAPARIDQHLAGPQQPALDEVAERHPWRIAAIRPAPEETVAVLSDRKSTR